MYDFLKIVILTSVFLRATASSAQKSMPADSTKLVIDGSLFPFSQLNPGDTIKLLPGIRPFLIFKNINGTAEQPIIICNEKGIVEINSDHYFGISIRQSKYIKISGRHYPESKYGIKVFNRVGSGLCIGDYSSFVEVEGIEVGYSQYSGIVAKTEPFCGFLRNSFIQENTSIHDCYVHHTGTEGMYIGSSFYNGQLIQCNGSATTVFPPLLKNVDVYNNIVEFSGWDGIQVSSAINARIHHNLVRYDSQKKIDWQMNGIILGEGSTGEIYSNEIKDGEGSGIFTNGLGDIFIYNNKILRPGKNNNLPSGKYGLYIDEKSAISGLYFYLFNNLVLNPKGEAIRFISYHGKKKNYILNNSIIKESTDPDEADDELIKIVGEKVTTGCNFITRDISLLRFKDAPNDNFQIESGSLLIDAGQTVSFKNSFMDFNDNSRIKGYAIDIGPYESDYERETSVNIVNQDFAYPNPVSSSEKVTICFTNPVEGWIEFMLVDQTGKRLKQLDRTYFYTGKQYKTIAASDLSHGINFIRIKKRMEDSMVRISVDEF